MGCSLSTDADEAPAKQPMKAVAPEGPAKGGDEQRLHSVDGRFGPLDTHVPTSEDETRVDPATILRVEVASMEWRMRDSSTDDDGGGGGDVVAVQDFAGGGSTNNGGDGGIFHHPLDDSSLSFGARE